MQFIAAAASTASRYFFRGGGDLLKVPAAGGWLGIISEV